MINESREWTLTPAYDLTCSPGPGGEHSMTVAGEGRQPGAKDFMKLGKAAGLSRNQVSQSLEQVLFAVKRWQNHAQIADVMEKSKDKIELLINRNVKKAKITK